MFVYNHFQLFEMEVCIHYIKDMQLSYVEKKIEMNGYHSVGENVQATNLNKSCWISRNVKEVCDRCNDLQKSVVSETA